MTYTTISSQKYHILFIHQKYNKENTFIETPETTFGHQWICNVTTEFSHSYLKFSTSLFAFWVKKSACVWCSPSLKSINYGRKWLNINICLCSTVFHKCESNSIPLYSPSSIFLQVLWLKIWWATYEVEYCIFENNNHIVYVLVQQKGILQTPSSIFYDSCLWCI